jgi:hypothetical protein
MFSRQPLRFLLADDPGAGKTILAGLFIRDRNPSQREGGGFQFFLALLTAIVLKGAFATSRGLFTEGLGPTSEGGIHLTSTNE